MAFHSGDIPVARLAAKEIPRFVHKNPDEAKYKNTKSVLIASESHDDEGGEGLAVCFCQATDSTRQQGGQQIRNALVYPTERRKDRYTTMSRIEESYPEQSAVDLAAGFGDELDEPSALADDEDVDEVDDEDLDDEDLDDEDLDDEDLDDEDADLDDEDDAAVEDEEE